MLFCFARLPIWEITGLTFIMQNTIKERTVKTSATIGNTSTISSTINPQTVRRPMHFKFRISQGRWRGKIIIANYSAFFNNLSR